MIKSAKNRLLKDIRRLRRCKGDQAVLEGPHLLREAAGAGIEIETLLVTPQALADAADSFARLAVRPLEITPEALASVTESDAPRGVLAIARLPRGGVESLPLGSRGVWVLLDELQDPGNVGAVARSVEASGATGLALTPGCAHPNHPRTLRASAGSLLRLPTAVGVDADALARRLEPVSPEWIALAADGTSRLWEALLAPPLVLVVGGERGLAPDLAGRCDRTLRLPMASPVESLNAAVAAALTLFEIRRQAG